jgi:Uma2 family endonuclease
VIELISPSDSVSKAQQKVERWFENGATGFLIDPYKKKVYSYEFGEEASVVSGNAVHGKGPVEGFVLDLDEVWRCYEI